MIKIVLEVRDFDQSLVVRARVSEVCKRIGIEPIMDDTICNTFNDARWLRIRILGEDVLSFCIRADKSADYLAESLVRHGDHILMYVTDADDEEMT